MSVTQEEALRPVLVRGSDGAIDVIRVKGIVCDTAMIDGVLFNPRNITLGSATIGGITLSNGTISSAGHALYSANGTIDMGGASLVNVGSIIANADDYRSVYTPVSSPSGGTTIAGIVTLPAGNVIANVYITILAMSAGGLSVTVQLGYKVKRYLGVVSLMLSGYSTSTYDDPIFEGVTTTLADAGGGVLNVNIINPSPLTLQARAVASVSLLTI